VFSDSLEPDESVPVEKIAATKLYFRDNAGKVTVLDWKKGEHAYLVNLPDKNPAVVGGVCNYGVTQRGKGKPFLLAYYPKLVLGEMKAAKAWDKLPLEIVPQGEGRFQLLFGGKPAAEAEVVVVTPAAEEDKKTLKSDARGEFKVPFFVPGIHAIRARYVESKTGEYNGKKHEEVRHYATLVFQVAATKHSKADRAKNPTAGEEKQVHS
jgi:hypothetical protein